MKFQKESKIPFTFVTAASCPTCNARFETDIDEAKAGRAKCRSCGTDINLSFAKQKKHFNSINMSTGSCPYCSEKVVLDMNAKRNGIVKCEKCGRRSAIWSLKKIEFEENSQKIEDFIDKMIDQNQIDAALAYIDTSIKNEKARFISAFGRTKWIFTFGESFLHIFGFLPKWINLEGWVVAPVADLLIKIFAGTKISTATNNFVSLCYRKVLLTANRYERTNEWDLNLLLEEVYLFLILIETNDQEAFYNQLNYYLQYTPTIKNIDRTLNVIGFFFDTSAKKDEEWLEIFWISLATIVDTVYFRSELIKSVRGYYRHIILEEQELHTVSERKEKISVFEEVLGVVWRGDNFDEIKRRYRKLVSVYHPDKKTGNQEKFLEIQEAYLFFLSISN